MKEAFDRWVQSEAGQQAYGRGATFTLFGCSTYEMSRNELLAVIGWFDSAVPVMTETERMLIDIRRRKDSEEYVRSLDRGVLWRFGQLAEAIGRLPYWRPGRKRGQ